MLFKERRREQALVTDGSKLMSFAAVNTFTSFLVPLTRHKKESAMAFASGFPGVYPKSQLRILHFTSPREVGPGLNRVRTRQMRKDFHYIVSGYYELYKVNGCMGCNIIVTGGCDTAIFYNCKSKKEYI